MYRDALGLNSLRGLRMRKTVRPFLGAAISKMPCVLNQRINSKYQKQHFPLLFFGKTEVVYLKH